MMNPLLSRRRAGKTASGTIASKPNAGLVLGGLGL